MDIIHFFADKPDCKCLPTAFHALKIFCAKNGIFYSGLNLENNLTTLQKSDIMALIEPLLKASPLKFEKVEVLIDLIALISKSGINE